MTKKPKKNMPPPKVQPWSATLAHTRQDEYVDEIARKREQKTGKKQKKTRAYVSDGMVVGRIDAPFFIATMILLVIGLLMMLSASTYEGSVSGDALAAFRSQILFALVGLGGMIVFMIVDYRVFKVNIIVVAIMAGGIFLLALLKVLPEKGFILNAPVINGSQRWIRIGTSSSFSIQPSEIAKFALVVFLAAILSKPGALEKKLYWGTFLRCLVVIGAYCGLVMLQPNLSTTIVLAAVSAILLFVAGLKGLHLGGLAVLGGGAAYALAMSADYRRKRMMTFINPWKMSSDDAYQLVQSLYALANGGLFGTGWGMSRQKQMFLPYASSDFIFAIVAEELGFVGSVIILGLFFWMIYCGIRIAIGCPDRFGQLLATGLISLIAVQVIVNVAVVNGMAPTTGLPLPFFTEGGTSLAIFMTEAGILMNISRHRRPTER